MITLEDLETEMGWIDRIGSVGRIGVRIVRYTTNKTHSPDLMLRYVGTIREHTWSSVLRCGILVVLVLVSADAKQIFAVQ